MGALRLGMRDEYFIVQNLMRNKLSESSSKTYPHQRLASYLFTWASSSLYAGS